MCALFVQTNIQETNCFFSLNWPTRRLFSNVRCDLCSATTKNTLNIAFLLRKMERNNVISIIKYCFDYYFYKHNFRFVAFCPSNFHERKLLKNLLVACDLLSISSTPFGVNSTTTQIFRFLSRVPLSASVVVAAFHCFVCVHFDHWHQFNIANERFKLSWSRTDNNNNYYLFSMK